MATGILADETEMEISPPRDLAWEHLFEACSAARLGGAKDYSLYLVLEAVLKAHEANRLGSLAVFLETSWDVEPGDHEGIEDVVGRMADVPA